MANVSPEAIERARQSSYDRYRQKLQTSQSHITCLVCGRRVAPRSNGKPRAHFRGRNEDKVNCIEPLRLR